MRTTLTLDPDVAAAVEQRRQQQGHSLKQEINALLRLGLLQAEVEPARAEEPFRTETFSAGRILYPLDDVEAAIAWAEGEDHR
jgi:hypothetical protein